MRERVGLTCGTTHAIASVSSMKVSFRHPRFLWPPKQTTHWRNALAECPQRKSGGAPLTGGIVQSPVSKSSWCRSAASRPLLLRPPYTNSRAPTTAHAWR